MSTDEIVKRLPDCYQQDKDSNNYKLLELALASIKAFSDDNQQLTDMLNIEQATGKTLELYGEMYNQQRGALSDESFRKFILLAACKNFSTCDYNSTVSMLANVFGVDIKSFVINEGEEALSVTLSDLPLEVLLELGIREDELRHLIKSLLTVGITLNTVELSGTFEFSTSADDYNELAGFGDIEQTIGGYFGLLAEDNTKIPI